MLESFLRKLQTFKQQLYEKEAPTQVFFCKLHEIFMKALLQNISDGCFWQFQDSSQELYLKVDHGFCKFFKNIFWQISCGWLLLVFICEFWEVFLDTRCHPGSLQKKLFHTSSFTYFAFIFSESITITFSEETLRVCQHNFFQKL